MDKLLMPQDTKVSEVAEANTKALKFCIGILRDTRLSDIISKEIDGRFCKII